MLFFALNIGANTSNLTSANISKSCCGIYFNVSSHKFCFWKGNSYQWIYIIVRCENNCLRLFSANSSSSESWQYYFNTKRCLAQSVNKSVQKRFIVMKMYACFEHRNVYNQFTVNRYIFSWKCLLNGRSHCCELHIILGILQVLKSHNYSFHKLST